MDRPNASFAWHFPDGRSPWPLRPAFQGVFASFIHAFMVLESVAGRLHSGWPRGRESVGMEEFVSPKRGSFCNALPARHSRFNVTGHIPPSNSRTGDAGCAGCWPDQRQHGESEPRRQPFPRTGERSLQRSPAATLLPVYQFDEDWLACTLVARLNLRPPLRLCLDCTNW